MGIAQALMVGVEICARISKMKPANSGSQDGARDAMIYGMASASCRASRKWLYADHDDPCVGDTRRKAGFFILKV